MILNKPPGSQQDLSFGKSVFVSTSNDNISGHSLGMRGNAPLKGLNGGIPFRLAKSYQFRLIETTYCIIPFIVFRTAQYRDDGTAETTAIPSKGTIYLILKVSSHALLSFVCLCQNLCAWNSGPVTKIERVNLRYSWSEQWVFIVWSISWSRILFVVFFKHLQNTVNCSFPCFWLSYLFDMNTRNYGRKDGMSQNHEIDIINSKSILKPILNDCTLLGIRCNQCRI